MQKDTTLLFNELLEEENTFTIYQINIQKLAIKMYKVKYKKALKLIWELFTEAFTVQEILGGPLAEKLPAPTHHLHPTWALKCQKSEGYVLLKQSFPPIAFIVDYSIIKDCIIV